MTIELPADLLVREGLVPAAFFDRNESVEILRVYAFQPRDRVLLVRVVRTGPSRTLEEISRSRQRLRRRYHLRDFEILRVENGGRVYIALLRQRNPTALEKILENLGTGVTLMTPTIVRKDSATVSFLADDTTAKQVFGLLDGLAVRWRLRSRKAVRHGAVAAEDELTARQREILSLAWNLGYFEIPAKIQLQKLAELTGLSRNSVSQHLRRGVRRILRESLL